MLLMPLCWFLAAAGVVTMVLSKTWVERVVFALVTVIAIIAILIQ